MITQENIQYTADEIKAMVKTCEKYNKAREKAKRLLKEEGNKLNVKTLCEYFFPEIKESEDEQSNREWILEYLYDGLRKSDEQFKTQFDAAIAWLEKQGKQKGFEADVTESCFPDRGCLDVACEDDYELVEQKFDDKVKPKFKAEDYIVPYNITSLTIWKIINIDEDGYYNIRSITNPKYNKIYHVPAFFLERDYRLWTIKDAKPGDVLANDHHILILKELVYNWSSNGTPDSVKAYCGIKPNGNFEIDKDNWCFCGTLHIHPATKEQRDLLFQTMKEEGYEWDAEKKELKKIDQKPYNNVEPKFHPGDWIVDKAGLAQQVLDFRGGIYTCTYNSFTTDCESNYHLWTIQDAKPGDVLFQDLMGGMTFIYSGVNPDMAILYSFIISNDGEDVLPYHIGKPNTGIGYIEENENIIYPATKEQCDLLFRKMEEAGYKWDSEKKELYKIVSTTLNANEVIEWIDEHVPTKFEDMQNYVNQFKKDFGL